MWLRPRESDGADSITNYVNPEKELNAGLWSLWAGATLFLGLRLYCKITRRHGLWYDDYILILAWSMLLLTDAMISHQYATGYVPVNGSKWDDRMHILINISSCTNVLGQAWSKTAFGVTLLKLTNKYQQWIIWFCIVTMNVWMAVKVIFQWAKLCDEKSYDVWYRLDFCLDKTFRDDFKEAGNIYNIVMDFVFAFFPWWITWKLDMRKNEKIGLCITMSLGVVVAVVAAIRVAWKDEGNKRDPYYYQRNGISNVWYSSEVAGTILVQCIPVLRPFLREVHASLTSKRLPSEGTTSRRSWAWTVSKKRDSTTPGTPIMDLKALEGTSGMNGLNFGFNETKISSNNGLELETIRELDDEEKAGGITRGRSFRTVSSKRSEHLF
ncbi:uncharacterized protein N0V89_001359 [Didymosphaeria variabile]|uniref:Rhodopsin domain-containing protein n=1 Tax=Didymosphaeria variabile TaxID=1932322 RepID=A0A9W8XYI9_9PLEO|nr:uncharacterized protein N0V89_001359 [Didymosphaeria variabile]KAJ4360792.1 hypothetical protein N0V89_001359 [Didymosphaeria variabile]